MNLEKPKRLIIWNEGSILKKDGQLLSNNATKQLSQGFGNNAA